MAPTLHLGNRADRLDLGADHVIGDALALWTQIEENLATTVHRRLTASAGTGLLSLPASLLRLRKGLLTHLHRQLNRVLEQVVVQLCNEVVCLLHGCRVGESAAAAQAYVADVFRLPRLRPKETRELLHGDGAALRAQADEDGRHLANLPRLSGWVRGGMGRHVRNDSIRTLWLRRRLWQLHRVGAAAAWAAAD